MFKKVIKKYYYINNNKINNSIKIILMSDIHISCVFNVNKIDILLKIINDEKPDYVCIPGDLIDETNILNEKKYEDIVLNFIGEMSKICRVILSLGNHDFSKLINSSKIKWEYDKNVQFFNKLRKIKNVYLLDNEIYSDNNINFIGLTLSFEYFMIKNEDRDLFVKEINSFNLKIPKNDFNILLCHSPIYIMNDYTLKNVKLMKNIDLVLSGHMHNGMVFPLLDKIWKGNNGIITPNRILFPNAKMTRGIVKKKEKNLIISGGVTKLSYSAPNFLYKFNVLYPMNIEVININK